MHWKIVHTVEGDGDSAQAFELAIELARESYRRGAVGDIVSAIDHDHHDDATGSTVTAHTTITHDDDGTATVAPDYDDYRAATRTDTGPGTNLDWRDF